MATYHFSTKLGMKGNGFNHAKYICREGKYKEKEDMEYIEHGNMPEWAKDRPIEFWRAADEYERANGRVYREIEIALPNELTSEQRRELVQEFIKDTIGENHPYTLAIHCPKAALKQDVEQPHAHIMFCERMNDGIVRSQEQYFKRANTKNPELGGAKKDIRWNKKETLEHLREQWAEYQNRKLEKYGHEIRVDHRSLEAQRKEALEKGDYEKAEELDRPAEKHLGPKVTYNTVKMIKEHIAKAKTPEERVLKRDEYYDKYEKSERAKHVFYLREYKRVKRAIEKEMAELQKGVPFKQEHKIAIDKINKEIIKLTIKQKELKKKVITPERAIAIAYSVYSKGEYTRLREEAKAIEKELKNLTDEEKKFALKEKPAVLDIQARKLYDAELKRLVEWRKEYEEKFRVHTEKMNKLKASFETPEGRNKIKEIVDGVMRKNAPIREQLQELEIRLQELRTDRGKILHANMQKEVSISKVARMLKNVNNEIAKSEKQQQNLKGADLHIRISDDEEERKRKDNELER
jgi:hypothetical protein